MDSFQIHISDSYTCGPMVAHMILIGLYCSVHVSVRSSHTLSLGRSPCHFTPDSNTGLSTSSVRSGLTLSTRRGHAAFVQLTIPRSHEATERIDGSPGR